MHALRTLSTGLRDRCPLPAWNRFRCHPRQTRLHHALGCLSATITPRRLHRLLGPCFKTGRGGHCLCTRPTTNSGPRCAASGRPAIGNTQGPPALGLGCSHLGVHRSLRPEGEPCAAAGPPGGEPGASVPFRNSQITPRGNASGMSRRGTRKGPAFGFLRRPGNRPSGGCWPLRRESISPGETQKAKSIRFARARPILERCFFLLRPLLRPPKKTHRRDGRSGYAHVRSLLSQAECPACSAPTKPVIVRRARRRGTPQNETRPGGIHPAFFPHRQASEPQAQGGGLPPGCCRDYVLPWRGRLSGQLRAGLGLPGETLSRETKPQHHAPPCPATASGTFNPLCKVLCILQSLYLCAIGLMPVFAALPWIHLALQTAVPSHSTPGYDRWDP